MIMHDEQTAGLIQSLVIIDCPSTLTAGETIIINFTANLFCENMEVELLIRTDGVVGLTDRAQSKSVYAVCWDDKKS